MLQHERTVMDNNDRFGPFFYLLSGILIGIIIAAIILTIFNTNSFVEEFAKGINPEALAPEAFGLIVAVGVIDVFARRRELNHEEKQRDIAKEEAIVQEKERLILQMGSPDNAFAREAVRTLKARRWGFGEDKSLRRKDFDYAQLTNADLEFADLEGSFFRGANLNCAKLMQANLNVVHFETADLVQANLSGSNLERAELIMTDFHDATIVDANLQRANFNQTELQGANLTNSNLAKSVAIEYAKFDETTTLPDGSKWTPNTDMMRFVEPNHRDFFSPNTDGLLKRYTHHIHCDN